MALTHTANPMKNEWPINIHWYPISHHIDWMNEINFRITAIISYIWDRGRTKLRVNLSMLNAWIVYDSSIVTSTYSVLPTSSTFSTRLRDPQTLFINNIVIITMWWFKIDHSRRTTNILCQPMALHAPVPSYAWMFLRSSTNKLS